MAMFPAHSLWPAHGRVPVFRLVAALLIGPTLLVALISAVVFVIAGMTEATEEAVLRVTVESALSFLILVVAFTLTFGLAAIAILWRVARRGVLAWALAGGVAGGLFGALFTGLAMRTPHPSLSAAFAVAGFALFLLIRWIAGIRDVPAAG